MRITNIFLVGVFLATVMFLFYENASADQCEQDGADITKLNQEQILEEYGDCPLSQILWIDEGMDDEYLRLIQSWIGTSLLGLGYVDGDIEANANRGIAAYQRQIEEVPTGKLTYRQFLKVSEQLDASEAIRVILPFDSNSDSPFIYGNTKSGYVGFSGTWVIEGEGNAYPYNYHSYECRRESCRSIEINLAVEPSSVQLLSPTINDFKVLEWNESEIVIIDSSASENACRKSQIHINLNTKQVFEITRQVSTCEILGEAGNLEKPRISRLTGSYDFSSKRNAERLEESVKVYSKEYRDKIIAGFDGK